MSTELTRPQGTLAPPVRPALHPLAGPAAVAGLATLGLAFVGIVDPADGHYPTCPSRSLLGVHCPVCGSVRGLHALAHGDVAGLVARNPLLPVGMGLVAWAWLHWVGARTGAFALRPLRISGRGVRLALAVLVTFTVARNLPWVPFSSLAP